MVIVMRKIFVLLSISFLMSCGGDTTTPESVTPVNNSPILNVESSFLVFENLTPDISFSATDVDGDSLTFSISGEDAAAFSIKENVINLQVENDFEAPSDANEDNVFLFTLTVSDGVANVSKDISLTVLNSLEGRVVDGPLSGATVFIDANNNYQQDPNEDFYVSDESGYFAINGTIEKGQKIVSIGGTDTITNQPLDDAILAFPASFIKDAESKESIINITPLSTIITVLDEANTETSQLITQNVLDGIAPNLTIQDVLTQDTWEQASQNNEVAKKAQVFNNQIVTLLNAIESVSAVSPVDSLQALGATLTSEEMVENFTNLDNSESVTKLLEESVTNTNAATNANAPSQEVVSIVAEAIAQTNTFLSNNQDVITTDVVSDVLTLSQTVLPDKIESLVSTETSLSVFTVQIGDVVVNESVLTPEESEPNSNDDIVTPVVPSNESAENNETNVDEVVDGVIVVDNPESTTGTETESSTGSGSDTNTDTEITTGSGSDTNTDTEITTGSDSDTTTETVPNAGSGIDTDTEQNTDSDNQTNEGSNSSDNNDPTPPTPVTPPVIPPTTPPVTPQNPPAQPEVPQTTISLGKAVTFDSFAQCEGTSNTPIADIDTDGDGIVDAIDVAPTDKSIARAVKFNFDCVANVGVTESIQTTSNGESVWLNRNTKAKSKGFISYAYAEDNSLALVNTNNLTNVDKNGDVINDAILSSENFFVAESITTPDGRFAYLLTSPRIQDSISDMSGVSEVCHLYVVDLTDNSFECALDSNQVEPIPVQLQGSSRIWLDLQGMQFRADNTALFRTESKVYLLTPDFTATELVNPIPDTYRNVDIVGYGWLDDQHAYIVSGYSGNGYLGPRLHVIDVTTNTVVTSALETGLLENGAGQVSQLGNIVYVGQKALRWTGSALEAAPEPGGIETIVDPYGRTWSYIDNYFGDTPKLLISSDDEHRIPMSQAARNGFDDQPKSGTGSRIVYKNFTFNQDYVLHKFGMNAKSPIQAINGLPYTASTIYKLPEDDGFVIVDNRFSVWNYIPTSTTSGDVDIPYTALVDGVEEARNLVVPESSIKAYLQDVPNPIDLTDSTDDVRDITDNNKSIMLFTPEPHRLGFCLYQISEKAQQCALLEDYESTSVRYDFLQVDYKPDYYNCVDGNCSSGIQNLVLLGDELYAYFRDDTDGQFYAASASISSFMANGESELSIKPVTHTAGESEIMASANVFRDKPVTLYEDVKVTSSWLSLTIVFEKSLNAHATLPVFSQPNEKVNIVEQTWNQARTEVTLTFEGTNLSGQSTIDLSHPDILFLADSTERYQLPVISFVMDSTSILSTSDEGQRDPGDILDTDGDGIVNNRDDDDDGDLVLDIDDAFPLDVSESIDTDLDGLGNNADTDDDNDGVLDTDDDAPLNPKVAKDNDKDGIDDVYDVDPNDNTITKYVDFDFSSVSTIGISESLSKDDSASLVMGLPVEQRKGIFRSFIEKLFSPAIADDNAFVIKSSTNLVSWDSNGVLVTDAVMSNETMFIAEMVLAPNGNDLYLFTAPKMQQAINDFNKMTLNEEVCQLYKVNLAQNSSFKCVMKMPSEDNTIPTLLTKLTSLQLRDDYLRDSITFRADGTGLLQSEKAIVLLHPDDSFEVLQSSKKPDAGFVKEDKYATWLDDEHIGITFFIFPEEGGLTNTYGEVINLASGNVIQEVDSFMSWRSAVIDNKFYSSTSYRWTGQELVKIDGPLSPVLDQYGILWNVEENNMDVSKSSKLVEWEGTIKIPISFTESRSFGSYLRSGTGTDIRYKDYAFSDNWVLHKYFAKPASEIVSINGETYSQNMFVNLGGDNGTFINLENPGWWYYLRSGNETGDVSIPYTVKLNENITEKRSYIIPFAIIEKMAVYDEKVYNFTTADDLDRNERKSIIIPNPLSERQTFCLFNKDTLEQKCAELSDYDVLVTDYESEEVQRFFTDKYADNTTGTRAFPGVQNIVIADNRFYVYFKDSADNQYYQATASMDDFMLNGDTALSFKKVVNGAGESEIIARAASVKPEPAKEYSDIVVTQTGSTVTLTFASALNKFTALPTFAIGDELVTVNNLLWNQERTTVTIEFSLDSSVSERTFDLTMNEVFYIKDKITRFKFNPIKLTISSGN